MSSSFINSFKVIPKELFRVNNGRYIQLREWTVKRSRSYDLRTEAGNVKPKALNPMSYIRKPYLYHISRLACNSHEFSPERSLNASE